ncbi:MAG: acyl-CoA thioester hydrolase [Solirubrobacteraceae bacterium]|nr:acyl-CoA thioester hydrolase [Solirubrobacteraceae bacterium]
MHSKRIEIRWRDVDNYGHVNNAVYLTYLEEVRDEWLARTLRDPEAIWDYVVAHVSIDFRHEIVQADDHVVAACSLERIGTASVRTREEVRTAAGTVAAEATAVLVARDRDGTRSRPISADERAAFERELAAAETADPA